MNLYNTMTPDEQVAFNAHLNERERRSGAAHGSPAAYVVHLDLAKEEFPVCLKHANQTEMVAMAIGAPCRFTVAPEGLFCVHCKQENAD